MGKGKKNNKGSALDATDDKKDDQKDEAVVEEESIPTETTEDINNITGKLNHV